MNEELARRDEEWEKRLARMKEDFEARFALLSKSTNNN
jgi:hypothetical protein